MAVHKQLCLSAIWKFGRIRTLLLLALLVSTLTIKLQNLAVTSRIVQSIDRTATAQDQIPMPLLPLRDGRPCSELPSQFPNSIPPLVHWTTKDGRVPFQLLPIVRTWRRLIYSKKTKSDTERWHFMHWDDQQISELVSKHYPRLAPSYRKLINGLERSDIGRLVVLHHVGGLYVDTDVELLRDPTPMLRPSQLLGAGLSPNFSCESAVWSQEPVEHPILIFNIRSMISNAVMMSRGNHSFLSFVLNNWPQWFEDKWAKNKKRLVNDAVFVTGPIMLQSFYEKYTALQQSDRPEDWCGNLLAEPDTFQPVCDWGYRPRKMKLICANSGRLTELQRQFCRRVSKSFFKEKQIPKSSFTLHNFLHLSYREKSKMSLSTAFSSIFPTLSCKI